MTIFRAVFGIFVCCLLSGHTGCVLAQPHSPQQVYRSLPATGRVPQNPIQRTAIQQPPSQQAPIQQAAYTPVHRMPVHQQSHASAELYQPWNLNEFSVRPGESGTPYRLVSDTQSSAPQTAVAKTPPPAGGLQHLFTPRTAPQTPAAIRTTSARVQSPTLASRMPVLGIGRDILNEFRPSNDRQWTQNHAVLQTATFKDNFVTVHNVRYSRYESAEAYTTQYYDAAFDLDEIRTIDLVMVPFQGLDRLAHVESSFGFADGRHIGLSIEARYEEGEKYDPAAAGLNQFELIYVFADERDMIRLATDVNKNDVFIYRLNFEPHEVRTMFVDALQRANKLAAKPEFYHPLTNSCVTNLIDHINEGRPKAVPREYRTLVPGLLDSYMYDLNLVTTPAKTFKEAKETAKINWLVERYGDLEYFSAGIRQNMY